MLSYLPVYIESDSIFKQTAKSCQHISTNAKKYGFFSLNTKRQINKSSENENTVVSDFYQ